MKKPAEYAVGARRSWGEGFMILAVVLYAALVLVAPLVGVLVGALGEGWRRFFEEITRPEAWAALRLTVELALAAAAVNAGFGLLTAVVLVRQRFRGRRLLNALVDLPFGVSPVVAGLALILLFGREGWLESVVAGLGIRVVFHWPGLLLATVFVSLPFVIREVAPLLEQVGRRHEEAAMVMGARPWQAFLWVTFPAVRWAFAYGIVLTLARSLGEFGAVLVVGGGVAGLTETATIYIFHALDARNEVGAFAVALILAAVTGIVFMGAEVIKRRVKRSRAENTATPALET
ncbi:MAG: sulfate ABC transporter permease subunit CysW [Acidobacteriota bacterium]